MAVESNNAAVEAAAEAASETAKAIQAAEGVANAVVAAAADQVEEAQRVAEDIARAAMETELGRRITTLTDEVGTWRAEFDLRLQQAESLAESLKTELAALQASLIQPTVLVTGNASSQTEPLSSIPSPLPAPETTPAIVIPAQSVVAESPAAEIVPRKARSRWI